MLSFCNNLSPPSVTVSRLEGQELACQGSFSHANDSRSRHKGADDLADRESSQPSPLIEAQARKPACRKVSAAEADAKLGHQKSVTQEARDSSLRPTRAANVVPRPCRIDQG